MQTQRKNNVAKYNLDLIVIFPYGLMQYSNFDLMLTYMDWILQCSYRSEI